MAITINQVFPWGRSFEEYGRMFRLRKEDLALRIAGCADGPADFNAEMHRRGRRVVSCDPLYQFSAEEIRRRIAATFDQLIAEAVRTCDRYVWDTIRSPQELGRVRMAAMDRFLKDYRKPENRDRYLAAALPHLPLANDSFDLALCSHFLFLYSAELTLEFHLEAIQEMCRVAREVRIFPLVDRKGQRSGHLEPALARLTELGLETTIVTVPYEFQRGGNQMLRIARKK